MSKECLHDCPVIKAIEGNIAGNNESDVLTEFFNNGLDSARRASDECQGPAENADKPREVMQAITLAEPNKVCGWNTPTQTEIILTP